MGFPTEIPSGLHSRQTLGTDIFVMEMSHSWMLFIAAFRINAFRLINTSHPDVRTSLATRSRWHSMPNQSLLQMR
jgi:hypothetical protein